jgi:acyl-CoA synthetase (AMP-forming)/AMP-acid ligase II
LMPDGFRPLAENAFHPTGDVGYFDSKRGLRLMARRHDIIKTGGYKIFPQEIEAALMKSLPSGEVMVIGIPSEYWGEIVLVAGEDTSGTWESHARKAAAALTRYKRPRFYLSMPSLPRNPTGKPDRKVLKQFVSERYRLTDGPHPRLDPID